MSPGTGSAESLRLAGRSAPRYTPRMIEPGLPDHTRRRRLQFRCWHRGMREVDLLLGRYVDAHLAEMSEEDLARLEALLDIPDSDLFAWLTGARPPEQGTDLALLRAIRVFHAGNPTIEDIQTE